MPFSRPGRAVLLSLFAAGCTATAHPAPETVPAPVGAEPAFELPALAPGQPISRAEYAQRREALAGQMGDGVLLVLGAPAPAADYLTFAQQPDLRYLTGITEPDAALVIVKRDGQVSEHLFVQPRDPAREVWEGERLGAEGAERRTGIPTRTTEHLGAVLDSLASEASRLYTTAPPVKKTDLLTMLSADQQVIRRLSERHPHLEVASVHDALLRLRAIKSATELDLIRRAVYITALAQRAAMRTIEPEMNEFEIQALIEYYFRRHGADRPSFATIVGSGPNATTLHYNADDRFMRAGDMVVMDVGASYRGYAADVTRSVPVNGTFSAEQREIYALVLAAQKAAEQRSRPGATWRDLNAAVDSVLSHGLSRLGLTDSPTATYDCGSGRCPQYRLFFLHGLGHGIGLEVHDPDISYYSPFRVGSAFTIEPGLYVREDALDHLADTPENRAMRERLAPVVARYANIGVRIEDDYFITPEGVERVSRGAPREIEEIEALMRLPGIGAADRLPEVVDWYRQTEAR